MSNRFPLLTSGILPLLVAVSIAASGCRFAELKPCVV
jgi:hypothetical protein